MSVTTCGIVMSIHLDTDARLCPAAITDERRQFIIGMINRMLHERFRERHDVTVRKICRAPGTVGILRAPKPDRRLLVEVNQITFGHVEGPAIKAREPIHIGWILADDEIEAGALHAL